MRAEASPNHWLATVGHSPWAVGLAIAALASIPRVIHPGISEFKLDESIAVLSSLDALHRHVIPLQGQGSSVAGAAQGPLLYDLVAAVLAVWQDPRAVVVVIGLLNALGVGLTYVMCVPRFGRRVALIAAILFMAGAWPIVFSRKIWPNDLLAPAAVVALWGLLRVVDPATKIPGLGRTWIGLAALVSLNFGGWPELVVPLAAMLALPRTRHGRAGLWTMAGLTVFIVSVSPRIPDAVAIVESILAGGTRSRSLDFSPFGYIIQLAGTDAYRLLAGPDVSFDFAAGPTAVIDGALRALLLAGAAIAFARWVSTIVTRQGLLAPEGIVLLWWLAPAAASVTHGPIVVLVHHYVGTYPTQFILIAIAIDTLATAARRALDRVGLRSPAALAAPGALGVAVVVGAAGIQLAVFQSYLQFIAAHPTGTFFGIPLGVSMQAAQRARRDRLGGPVVVLSNGDQVGVDIDPTVFAALTDNADLIYVNATQTAIIPDAPSSTLLVSPDVRTTALAMLSPWQGPDGPLSDDGAIGGPGAFERFAARSVGRWRPSTWLNTNAPLDDGASFVAAAIPRQTGAGDPLSLEIAWQVGKPPTRPSEQSVFAHLVGDGGQTYADQDYSPLPLHPWHPGDLVLNTFSLKFPVRAAPGVYWIDVGRYSRPGVQPIRLLSGGQTTGPSSLRLGPLVIPPADGALPSLNSTRQVFGRQIRLTGWHINVSSNDLTVTLRWQPRTEPAERYTVFVHLLDQSGQIVAQNDSEPLNGQFPTSTWEPRQLILDRHQISLDGVPAGRYQVEVGLYQAATGRRLSLRTGDADQLTSVKIGDGTSSG